MVFKGAGEVGAGLKGLHGCLPEVADAVLCRRAFVLGSAFGLIK